MHELPVTERILDIALKHAAMNQVSKIHSISLKVGGLTDLEDKWLQHYFDYLSKDTIARGAILKIIRGGIELRCGECKTFFATENTNLQEQQCPHCESVQGFEVRSGREYSIEEMVAE